MRYISIQEVILDTKKNKSKNTHNVKCWKVPAGIHLEEILQVYLNLMLDLANLIQLFHFKPYWYPFI